MSIIREANVIIFILPTRKPGPREVLKQCIQNCNQGPEKYSSNVSKVAPLRGGRAEIFNLGWIQSLSPLFLPTLAGSPSLNFYLTENPNISFKKTFIIYLFGWAGSLKKNDLFLAVLGLPCGLWAFSSCRGLLSSCAVPVSHCSGFLLTTTGSRVPRLQNLRLPTSRAR